MNTLFRSIWLSISIGVVAVAAQASEVPEWGPIPFAAYDSDGNGAISEQEFYTVRSQRMAARAAEGRPMVNAANAPQFSDFDTNGDGSLSPDELLAGQQRQMQQRGGRGMGPGAGGMGPGAGGRGGNMPTFAEFDLNGDGVLLEEEFNQAHAQRISERSQQGYPMRGLSNMLKFSDLDADGNGQVTSDEFTAGVASHRANRFQQQQ